MKGIKIYLEGGGDSKEGKAALRQGMSRFLDSVKQAARQKRIEFTIVPCGGRKRTYDAFKHALETEEATCLVFLLVDAESQVTSTPRHHLAKLDGWALNTVDEKVIHLMTQVMETWIVADSKALELYYKQGFVNCLPRTKDLETIDKSRIQDLLKRATKATQKQEYHKTRHAPDLLGLIDEAIVRRRCGFCNRLFSVLEARIRQS